MRGCSVQDPLSQPLHDPHLAEQHSLLVHLHPVHLPQDLVLIPLVISHHCLEVRPSNPLFQSLDESERTHPQVLVQKRLPVPSLLPRSLCLGKPLPQEAQLKLYRTSLRRKPEEKSHFQVEDRLLMFQGLFQVHLI